MQIIHSPSPLELGSNPFQTLLELGAGRDAQSFPLGNRRLLLLNHPDLLEWAFTSPALSRARFVRLFARFIGNGLITQDGEEHLMARRIMQKAFNRETLPGFMQAIADGTARELRTWHSGLIDLNTALTRVSQCATLQALFGLHEIPDQVAVAALFSASSGMAMGMNVNLDGLERRNGRFQHALADQTMDFVMQHWQDTPVVRQLNEFEGQARIDQTFAVMVAGFETSAAGLVWLFNLLLHHPEHLETVTQSVRDCSDLIHQVHRLSCLRNAVQEMLRLYPVAGWLNSREVREPVTLGDETLPVGTQVVMSSWLTHRDPRYFAHADQFRPQRFEQPMQPWTYLPFGAGVHQCLGSMLGPAQIMLSCALVLQAFDLRLNTSNLQPGLTMSLTPEGTLQASISRVKALTHA